MARITKGQLPKALLDKLAAGLPLTPAEWCLSKNVCISTWYAWQKTGRGPAVVQPPGSRRPLFTAEADAEWVKAQTRRAGEAA